MQPPFASLELLSLPTQKGYGRLLQTPDSLRCSFPSLVLQHQTLSHHFYLLQNTIFYFQCASKLSTPSQYQYRCSLGRCSRKWDEGGVDGVDYLHSFSFRIVDSCRGGDYSEWSGCWWLGGGRDGSLWRRHVKAVQNRSYFLGFPLRIGTCVLNPYLNKVDLLHLPMRSHTQPTYGTSDKPSLGVYRLQNPGLVKCEAENKGPIICKSLVPFVRAILEDKVSSKLHVPFWTRTYVSRMMILPDTESRQALTL